MNSESVKPLLSAEEVLRDLEANDPDWKAGERADAFMLRKIKHWKDGAKRLVEHASHLHLSSPQLEQEVKRLKEENENLKTVMIAAAEEIKQHWKAHCDHEGYGPSNLLHRLENGIPAQYGYTAGTFARMDARIKELERQLFKSDTPQEG